MPSRICQRRGGSPATRSRPIALSFRLPVLLVAGSRCCRGAASTHTSHTRDEAIPTMRVPAMIAAVALVLAACGGEKKRAETTETTEVPATHRDCGPGRRRAPPTWWRWCRTARRSSSSPAELTHQGGRCRDVQERLGRPAQRAVLCRQHPGWRGGGHRRRDPEQAGPVGLGARERGRRDLDLFAGAPVGDYRFTCLPHMAMGMHGKITVQ